MKQRRIIFIALAILLTPLASDAAPNVYQLTVDGLACPFCAYGIEKELSTLEGIEKFDIDLKRGTVVVTMAEGMVLTETAAVEAVRNAGFTLRTFSQNLGRE